MTYAEYGYKYWDHVAEGIIDARVAADAKWGRKSGGEGPWLDNPYSGLVILMEEVGEVARAALERDPESIERELYDVCQVAVAWLEAFEMRRNGEGKESGS